MPYVGDIRSSFLHQKLVQKTCTKYGVGVGSWYQKCSNTADQSNRTVLVTWFMVQASGTSFWYEKLERVSQYYLAPREV